MNRMAFSKLPQNLLPVGCLNKPALPSYFWEMEGTFPPGGEAVFNLSFSQMQSLEVLGHPTGPKMSDAGQPAFPNDAYNKLAS